jgi:aquaporin Z
MLPNVRIQIKCINTGSVMLPCAVAFRCVSVTERFNKEPSRNGLGAFMRDDLSRRVTAEFFGTFWLTFAGCGAAVLAAAFPTLGIGFVGVAFAFGLTVLTMAYAVGHISGGHFNPAVTLGLWSAGRCASKHVVPYIIAQVAAGIAAAAVLWLIASGKPDWVPGGFASNGYGDLSPGKYGLFSCALTEVLMTFFFLYIIIGTTSKGAAVGFAGIPIGLALTLIHLVSIPVTNTSVNPARSTGPALFAGGEYIAQLWLFWIGPIVGAVLAGLLARWMYEPDVLVETVVVEEREGRRTA